MRTVAHFIRKSSQLKATFIKNQITHHIDYKPIIIYRYSSDKDDGGFAEFNRNDILILNLSDRKKFDLNLRYLKKLSKKDLDKVLTFLRENNTSVLHFHYGSDACIYSDVIKYSGIPSVVSFYGYDVSSLPKSFWGLGKYYLYSRLFRYVTKVLAMSPDMKKDLLEANCPEEKIIVHYYGTDVKKFYQVKEYYAKSFIEFLIISGLEPKKGHLFLLESFKLAYENNQNINLKIFGDGSIKNEIEEFIKKNKMNSFVSMKGKINYGSPKHLEALKNADIFIHPSVIAKNGDKEGIPGTIVEAMASSLPVISTYHAGIPYIIRNEETGLLVDEWDVQGLVKAIERLTKDLVLRKKLGQNAQKFALANLNLKLKEIELEKIYSMVCRYDK